MVVVVVVMDSDSLRARFSSQVYSDTSNENANSFFTVALLRLKGYDRVPVAILCSVSNVLQCLSLLLPV
jgi:hypothetical protein